MSAGHHVGSMTGKPNACASSGAESNISGSIWVIVTPRTDVVGSRAGPVCAADCVRLRRGGRVGHGLRDASEVETKRTQDPGGNGLGFAGDRQQDVLGAELIVAQAQRFFCGERKQSLGARGERNRFRTGLLAASHRPSDLLAGRLKRDPQRSPRLGADALRRSQQPQQQMLAANAVAWLARHREGPTGDVGERRRVPRAHSRKVGLAALPQGQTELYAEPDQGGARHAVDRLTGSSPAEQIAHRMDPEDDHRKPRQALEVVDERQ